MTELAKIELHVHLEGTISPILAKKIALRNRIQLSPTLFSTHDSSYHSNDFSHFLHVFDSLTSIIRYPIDYYDIAYNYLHSCSLEGTLYVEMMFSPLHAEKMTGIPAKEHLDAIIAAIQSAETAFGITSRIIITGVRHYGVESCEAIAKEALKNSSPYVTGFGLGGDEINFPAPLFKKTYQIAKDAGLGLTIHVGEFGNADSILEAIDCCGVSRIGHGVNAIHSEKVMASIFDKNIHLEICPSSNLHFCLFDNLNTHPLYHFYKQGISLSINSDDPPFFSTSIGQEYQKITKSLGFTKEDFNRINTMAIQHAFLDTTNKQKILAKLKD